MFKKNWKRFLAMVCAISMIMTSQGFYSFDVVAEEGTTETLPTDFTEITPKDFGIADFAENEGNSFTSSVVPVESVDKVAFSANVIFGKSTQINYLYNAATTGGIQFLANENMYLYNWLSPGGSSGIYVGGQYVDGEYADGELIEGRNSYTIRASKISSTENFNTMYVLFTLTTEFVDFDGGGTADDLKLGVWFNGALYNESYFYLRNCLEVYKPYLNMSVTTALSPEKEPEPTLTAPDFEEITFRDFNVNDGTYGYINNDLAVARKGEVGVANKTFVGTVNFSEQKSTAINIGGLKSAWEGVKLVTLGANQLYFSEAYNRFPEIPISESAAGVSLKDNDVYVELSFEVTDLDEDGADDVRFWLSFDGVLYKGAPIVEVVDYAQYLGTYLGIYSTQEESSVSVASKFATTTSNMPEGYQIVTPLTYDVSDVEGIDASTPTESIGNVSIDKVLFSANVNFSTTGFSTIDYLHQNATGAGIRLQLQPNTSIKPRLYNYMAMGKLYAGGSFVNGEYQADAYEPIAFGSAFPIDKTIAEVDFFTEDFLLWYTTEFVDFDGDGSVDDLQIGIWFNEKLYNDMYFYVLDCKNVVYHGQVAASNLVSLKSPLLAPKDLGVEPGEYVSAAGEFYTTDKVTDKVMDGTTLYTQVRFEKQGGTLYYGCHMDNKDKAVKLTSDAEGLLVTHTFGEEEVKLGEINVWNTGINVLDHTFDLKLSTEVVDSDADENVDDVKLTVCIDNKSKVYYIEDIAELMTATMRMQCKEGASILIGTFGEDTPEQIAWCLDEGTPYEAVKAENASNLTVDGANYEEGASLYLPGVYSVVQMIDGKIYMQDVTVYRSYDVNADNVVTIMDLVRVLKLADDVTYEATLETMGAVGLAAIGYQETEWNVMTAKAALTNLRTAIVTRVTVESAVMELMTVEETDTYSFAFLGGTEVMPIGGFYGPKIADSSVTDFEMPTYISDEYFAKIQEAGVNLITYSDVYYDTSPSAVKKMLELGEKYGVGITVSDRRYLQAGDALTTEQATEYLSAYDSYSAFCGVYGIDEPTSEYYPETNDKDISLYATSINKLAELGVWSYGNLFPCYGEAYREAYNNYVEEWLTTCDVEMLLWDHYVHDKNVSVGDYFYSLSYGRDKAAEHNLPFWTFVQAGSQWRTKSDAATDSDGYYPNEGEFLWNVNTSLAYGAKGISYFPLIQPLYFATAESRAYDFNRNGMIGANGELNRWWYYAQNANRQIAAVDEVLMNAVSKGVIVTGEQAKADNVDSTCIMEGTAWRELTNIIRDVMVGCFNYQGKSAYYVVNYDMEYAQSITMEFSDCYAGKVIQNAEISNFQKEKLQLNLKAGEGVLVVME